VPSPHAHCPPNGKTDLCDAAFAPALASYSPATRPVPLPSHHPPPTANATSAPTRSNTPRASQFARASQVSCVLSGLPIDRLPLPLSTAQCRSTRHPIIRPHSTICGLRLVSSRPTSAMFVFPCTAVHSCSSNHFPTIAIVRG
jgi:hypothetical protein